MKKTAGYAYTTREVLSSIPYWRWFFESGRKANTDTDGSSVALAVTMLSATSTAWIVCADCVQYVEADHRAARAYAAAREEPPGCGAILDRQVACIPAGYGWSLTYGDWPTSIQVGGNPIIHDENAGSRCDFCRRIVYGDGTLGLLTAETYKKILDQGAMFVRKPPSKERNGTDCWIACGTCLSRADALKKH